MPLEPTNGRCIRPRLALAGVLVGLAAFVLANRTLGSLLPGRAVPVVSGKLRRLAEQRHDYDTVFIGSSRVFRALVPAEFDAALAERGIASRSFNLGVPGLKTGEAHYLLERVLDLDMRKLHRVFLEFRTSYVLERANRMSDRSLLWHDLGATWFALQACHGYAGAVGRRDPRGFELEQARSHLAALAIHELGLGRLAHLIERGPLPSGPRRDPVLDIGPGGDGYLSLEHERRLRGGGRKGNRPIERQAERFERRVRGLAASRPDLDPGEDEDQAQPPHSAFTAEMARRFEALARRENVELVFLLMPSQEWRADLERTLDGGRHVSFSFQDPERYPELYTIASRFDTGHLSEAGARVFSRRLAERVASELTANNATAAEPERP